MISGEHVELRTDSCEAHAVGLENGGGQAMVLQIRAPM
jgi:hypothetical protein